MPENNSEDKDKIRRIVEAKRIARHSQEVIGNNYDAIARRFVKIFRGFNKRLDFILTNSLSAKIVSIALAVLLYLSVNSSGDINVFGENNVGKNIQGIKVKAIYDRERFQVENLPETVDLSLVGSVEAIRKTEVLNKQEVIADLTNFKAGTNQKVELLYAGMAEGVNVKFSQPTYEVNIYDNKKKVFNIKPELTKVPIDDKYRYHDIKIENDSIELKAAQHTLDKVAYVKILVDVTNQTKDFKQEAKLVVIDDNGDRIEDITLPFDSSTVSVKVSKR